MDFKKYIEYVKKDASKEYNKNIALIALIEEVGEVAGLVKKKSIYPDFDFVKKYGGTFEEEIKDEMSDVLWQYVNLCNQLNLNIEDLIDYNVDKLNKRFNGSNNVCKDGGKR